MKRKQPFDNTNPKWVWRYDRGRLRMGYVTRYEWWLAGAYKPAWFIVFKNYPIAYTHLQTGGYWQFTILGLQVGYCYRKDFK